MSKVSVIIPIYNVEDYLIRCLDTLCNQTLKDIEIICVEDRSTDNSYEILKEYSYKDKRIKLIRLDVNSGAAVARNKGLEIATGEYLGFVDPDDSIDLNYYEELYKKAKESDYDIVKTRRKTIHQDGKITESNLNNTIKDFGRYFFSYEWTTAIYKKSLVIENKINFPIECRKAQDTVFLNRVVLVSKSLALIDNVYYYYYKRDNSLNATQIPIENIQSALKSAEIQLKDLNNSEIYNSFPYEYIYLYLNRVNSVIAITLFQNDSIEAKKMCAAWLISSYQNCSDKSLYEFEFVYKTLLPLIKHKKYNKLTRLFNSYKDVNQIDQNDLKFYIKFLYLLWENRQKKIMFWGASLHLENLIKRLNIKNKNIIGVIDKNPKKYSQLIQGYKIYSSEEIKDLKPDVIIFSIRNNNKLIYKSVRDIIDNVDSSINLVNMFY